MTKYFHFVLAKHRNDIEHKGKRLEGSPPHPHPVFSCILRGVINATSMFLRVAGSSIVGVALYTPPPGVTGGGEGEHAEKPLGNRSKRGTNPGSHSVRPSSERRAGATAVLPGLAGPCSRRRRQPPGSRGPTPTGGEEEDAPGPGSRRRQLTERRGARLLPREHAPAASDSSSVREKACAPPPGFRARS